MRSFYSSYWQGIFYRHTAKRALGSGALALIALGFVPDPAWPCAKKASVASIAGTSEGVAGASESMDAIARASGKTAVPLSPDDELIRKQSVCITSRGWSAGEIGNTVLYRYKRVGDELRVGYFVYWSTERPWGHNSLTYTLLPAIFVEAFYSHGLFLLPGARHMMYGPGDIEGALVVYDTSGGKLSPVRGVADDGTHNPSHLSGADLTLKDGRTALLTDVWSHQLGAHGAAEIASSPEAPLHCFSGERLQPLTDHVAHEFRLGTAKEPRRARPAWKAVSDG